MTDRDSTNDPYEAQSDQAPDQVPPREGTQAAPMSLPVKIAVAVIGALALIALLVPRGDGSFTAPGGFLVDAGGRPVKLGQRLAPVTLVHFWATWCPPCMTELPALRRLAADFADVPDFDIVMIAVDDEVDNVEPFLGSFAPMALFDPNWDVAKRYGTRKLPETYLVVRGRVVKVGKDEKWIGQIDWDDPGERARLEEALEMARAGELEGA